MVDGTGTGNKRSVPVPRLPVPARWLVVRVSNRFFRYRNICIIFPKIGIGELFSIELPLVRSISTGARTAAEVAGFSISRIVVLVEASSVPSDLERTAGLEVQIDVSGTFFHRPISHAEGAGALWTDDVAIHIPLLPGARAAFLDAGCSAGIARRYLEAPPGTISPFLPFVVRIADHLQAPA